MSEISKLSGAPMAALKEIAERGRGAHANNLSSVRVAGTFAKNPDTKAVPRSGRLSPQQWAFARIYSVLNKGKAYYTADADIVKKYNL